MIDLTKTTFEEKRISGEYKTKITASLALTTWVDVSEQELPKQRPNIHTELRRRLHHMIYGRLHLPICRLRSFALKNAPMTDMGLVQEVCEQLNCLLSGSPAAEISAKKHEPTAAEDYWLAAIKTIEPLSFNMRVQMLQSIVAVHEFSVPETLRDSVLKLMIE